MSALNKIDLHSHWFSPQVTKHLSEKSSGIRFIQDKDQLYLDRQKQDALPQLFALGHQWFDLDARLAHLEQHQVVHQLLSWPTTLDIDREISIEESRLLSRLYNDDLGQLVRHYPDTFSALAYLSTSDLEYAITELKRGHDELGLIGGVLPVGALSSYAAAQQFKPLFEIANTRRSHVYLHTGFAHEHIQHQTIAANFPQQPSQIQLLNTSYVFASAIFTLLFTDFLDDFPNITVQIAMLGGSGITAVLIEQMLQKQQRYPLPERYQQRLKQLTFDTGAAGDGIRAIEIMRDLFGIDRLVFGTDYAPQPSVDIVIQHIEQTNLSTVEKNALYFDTPAQLLRQKNLHFSHLQPQHTSSGAYFHERNSTTI